MTFDVGASTHRPKYRLWLGLYIITLRNFSDSSDTTFHSIISLLFENMCKNTPFLHMLFLFI